MKNTNLIDCIGVTLTPAETVCVAGGEMYCTCKDNTGWIVSWTSLGSEEECKKWCCSKTGGGYFVDVALWSYDGAENTHKCQLNLVETAVAYVKYAIWSSCLNRA